MRVLRDGLRNAVSFAGVAGGTPIVIVMIIMMGGTVGGETHEYVIGPRLP